MSIKSPLLYVFALILSAALSISYAQHIDNRLKQLTTGSDIIVTGKVSQQNSSWNANKTRIYTLATLEVDQYLKGNNGGNSVTVTYPGGEVGGMGELYTHMPKFVNNENVLVFLKKDQKTNSYRVFDGENGKIKIIKDAITGESITTSNVRVDYIKSEIQSYLKNKNK